MYLKSLSLKGFKSFPDRTRLQFSPGVSVVVGPNGSGKSNITDALLWALGEQSPLAVRGQSMQDVIFSGGKGKGARNVAEVEVLIDNSGGLAASELSEISITRRLSRDGEASYRLNGARCRLVDVIEVLSDTGLGKEMHSVISQGRVEQIVMSKPSDRRLVIEEAAGLGKHRKRRRRAELKLRRTQANLDRALDVEREARSRLRPLKRQAEAADLHARLQRQANEARSLLLADDLRALAARLATAEAESSGTRSARDELAATLAGVEERRREAEARFGARDAERGALSRRLTELRAARERLGIRIESLEATSRELATGLAEREATLTALGDAPAPDASRDQIRLEGLREQLATAEQALENRVRLELEKLEAGAEAAQSRLLALQEEAAKAVTALEEADHGVERSTEARGRAVVELSAAKARVAESRAELSAVEAQIAAASGGGDGGPALAGSLRVAPGHELAVSVALGERLRAVVVPSREAGLERIAEAEDAIRAIPASGASAPASAPPSPDARPLAEVVDADAGAAGAAERLLAEAWLVEDLRQCAERFDGIAVTRDGRAYDGRTGELRRIPAAAASPELAAATRREELSRAGAGLEEELAAAETRAAASEAELAEAQTAREAAEIRLREARRAAGEASEEASRSSWLLEQRRAGNTHDPEAVRAAQLRAELAAEERQLELVQRAHDDEQARRRRLAERIEAERTLMPQVEELTRATREARDAVAGRVAALERRAEEDRAAGEAIASELRACAQEEFELQGQMREASDSLTAAEVESAHARDAHDAAAAELSRVCEAIGTKPEAARQELSDEDREEAERRIERLARRREQLGPVNPLAQHEYDEAVAHVEELESQRSDLETALREVEGVIRETDRLIRESFDETFEATARNFEEMVAHLFPGGHGRLRLVETRGPERVIGGADPSDEPPAADAPWVDPEEGGDAAPPPDEAPDPGDPGVEIEVRPAGKAMRRLSLLSGGEKSLVAIAFLFSVFLARPCPFYVLDEIEAALDDANIDRFLQLIRRYSDRTQFIVVTHQKRTMDAADVLYGVTMGDDGVTKVVSRRLPREEQLATDAGALRAA